MLNYSFYKIDSNLRAKFDSNNIFMSNVFTGNETSLYIQTLIDNTENVKKSNIDSYYFANDFGFEAEILKPDSSNISFPNGSVNIYDTFGGDEPVLIISLDDILQLLSDFKRYLLENNR